MQGDWPEPQVSEGLLDHRGLLDELDDPQSSTTPGAHQRVYLVHLLDLVRFAADPET